MISRAWNPGVSWRPAAIAVWVALVAATMPASAQDYRLDWHSMDGGGGMYSGGAGWRLDGAIGQPDATLVRLTGGEYELVGGFWAVATPCSGDVTFDRIVSLDDLTILLSYFGTTSGATLFMGDFDASGAVDLDDLTLLLSQFGTTCP